MIKINLLQSDEFHATDGEMLKALNLNNSTNLSKTRKRDRLTIRYQARHGFKNLLKKFPKRTHRYRNADATIFITHYSGGAIKGNEIV